ncbi:MAG: hypothetical protein KAJ93_05975 [Methanosarcinales archaeon]|nr:hypothetical protein [Methanosarcinales archaeon]
MISFDEVPYTDQLKKVVLYLLIILTILMSGTIAKADWDQDGVSLHTIDKGTVNGGLYIGGGHGMVYTTTYTQNFTVPDGTPQWARLYVSAKDTSSINMTFNGHYPGNYTDLINNTRVYSNYQKEKGMYWVYYDNVAQWIVNGTNTATADLGTRVGYNTKSWGILLIVAYEGGDSPELIEYQVNEGNPLLHGNHSPFTAYHNTTNTSFGSVDPVGVIGAELTTVYIWGSEESEGEVHDTLWFNSELIATDASDGAGTDEDGNKWRGGCFDLKQWNISQNLDQDNVLEFDRGMDSILCPVVSVLVVKHYPKATASNQTSVPEETPGFGIVITLAVIMIITLVIVNHCSDTFVSKQFKQ